MTRGDLIAVILFCGALPVLVAAAIAVAIHRVRAAARATVKRLSDYAKARSIAIRTSEEQSGEVTFAAGGTLNEVRFELSVSRPRSRKAGLGGTKVRCRPKRAYAETLICSRRLAPTGVMPMMMEARTGDGAFDGLYALYTADAEDVMSWLGPKQRAYLASLSHPWELRASPKEITISSPEPVVEETDLDRAAWVATSIGLMVGAHRARNPLADATTRVCASCGMVFLAGEQTCPNCGSDLKRG